MNKNLINLIVKKYLRWDSTNPFISISALLAFIGVSVGVMVLIIAMAIMNGTSKEFEKKLFTMNYPLTIYPKIKNSVNHNMLVELESKFPSLKFSPYLQTQAIIQNSDNMSGGIIFAVDQDREKLINDIYAKATNDIILNKYDIILGAGINDRLQLSLGDKTTVFFTAITPSGFSQMPKMKRFIYINNFKSGLNAYDNAYMYTSLDAIQTILNKPNNIYDGIHVYSSQPFKDIKELGAFVDNYSVGIIGWWQQNGNFFAAMKMEKQALLIVLMLIVLIASLNIISSLLMTVMSRRKEIALLLSLGATKKEIKTIFLRLGTIIGFSGILLGILLGFTGIFILENFDIISLPADVYGSSKLPLELSLFDFMVILFGSSLMVWLSSYYPAQRATKINVLDILRNE
jgi:putative ABC transport system permease protein